MNYLKQILLVNRVWEKGSIHGNEVAVIMLLLHLCNERDWENPFNVSNVELQDILKMSYKTLANARKKLHAEGLLRFETKSGSAMCTYQILTACECDKYRAAVTTPKLKAQFDDEVTDEVTTEVADEVGIEVTTEVR